MAAAHAARRAELSERVARAPTGALKAKLETALERADEARRTLTAGAVPTGAAATAGAQPTGAAGDQVSGEGSGLAKR